MELEPRSCAVGFLWREPSWAREPLLWKAAAAKCQDSSSLCALRYQAKGKEEERCPQEGSPRDR